MENKKENNYYVRQYPSGKKSAVLWSVVSREHSPNGFVKLRRSDGKEISVTHRDFKIDYIRLEDQYLAIKLPF